MAQVNVDKLPAGPQLDALVAELVFGWKNVHRQASHAEEYWGKKPDKLGRFRSAKVPHYSTDARLSSQVEEQMRELKLLARYERELTKIAAARGLPGDWAPPDQHCRAALKALMPRPYLKAVKK